MNRIAIPYTRESTKRQADEGDSLEVQQNMISAYCAARGWTVHPKLYSDEGRSGRTTHRRPGLQSAIDHACRERGLLIVSSLSRLARSVRDACQIYERLHKEHADLVLVDLSVDTTTSIGKLVFSIMASVAEFESNQIGDRVRAAQAYAKDKFGHRRHGIQPPGYRIAVTGDREEVEAERIWLSQVLSAKQGRSYREALDNLNKQNIPTLKQLRNGESGDGSWSYSTLRRLVVSAYPSSPAP